MASWDSPLVLAGGATVAVHTILLVALDAFAVTHPLHLDPPPPHVTLVNVSVHRPPPPPPPPPAAPMPTPPATTPAAHTPAKISRAVVTTHAADIPLPTTPEPPPPAPAGGDGPTVAIADLGPGTTGVAVAKTPGKTGAGTGTGAGAGAGSGSGSGSGPVSVATIKSRALPRGDYSYYESKDYPAEAKRLGVEGTIRVKLVVDATGHVRSAVLLDHLGHGLDELALVRARAIEFTPARDSDDRDVSSVVIWTFQMTLPR